MQWTCWDARIRLCAWFNGCLRLLICTLIGVPTQATQSCKLDVGSGSLNNDRHEQREGLLRHALKTSKITACRIRLLLVLSVVKNDARTITAVQIIIHHADVQYCLGFLLVWMHASHPELGNPGLMHASHDLFCGLSCVSRHFVELGLVPLCCRGAPEQQPQHAPAAEPMLLDDWDQSALDFGSMAAAAKSGAPASAHPEPAAAGAEDKAKKQKEKKHKDKKHKKHKKEKRAKKGEMNCMSHAVLCACMQILFVVAPCHPELSLPGNCANFACNLWLHAGAPESDEDDSAAKPGGAGSDGQQAAQNGALVRFTANHAGLSYPDLACC